MCGQYRRPARSCGFHIGRGLPSSVKLPVFSLSRCRRASLRLIMGCTAFLDEVDSVTGGVNVTAAVFNLKLQSERSFFGSGVFETTAVVVAVFVAAYVVVPDPTGTQHAQDLSEYSVYAQWRWAMLILIADLGFTLAVIVHQLIECWRGSDVLWLVLLMFAPWAPVARQVFLTFAAWSRVRTMMRARMVSNTLTAVLREGFYLARLPRPLHGDGGGAFLPHESATGP